MEDPKWVIVATAGRGIKLQGARLPVEQGEFLVVGVVGNGDEPIETDAHCGITWVAADPDQNRPPPNPYR